MDILEKYLADPKFRKRRYVDDVDVHSLLQWDLIKAMVPMLRGPDEWRNRSCYSPRASAQFDDLFSETAGIVSKFMEYVEDGDLISDEANDASPSSPARDSIPHPGERHDG